VEATVENILENRLQPPRDLVADVAASSDSSSDGIESEDYESDGSLNSSVSSHSINRRYSDAEPSTSNVDRLPSHSTTWSPPPMEASNSMGECSYAQQATSGGRFSKSAGEREVMLEDRKQQLIDSNRNKYLASPRASDLKGFLEEDLGLLTNPEARRRLMLSAAERRMRTTQASSGT